MDNALLWYWFIGLEKVSLKEKYSLVQTLGSIEKIYKSNRKTLVDLRFLKNPSIDFLLNQKEERIKNAKKALEYSIKNQIQLITVFDEAYPDRLKNLYSPPYAFFAKGDLELLKNPLTLGIVGSRTPTFLGINIAKEWSKGLSQHGFTIISGMASGIDGSSHWGSVNELGGTIAVLGTGIDQCYPKENQKLYEKISEKGLLISEFSLGEKALPYHFPMRNRLISGLSQGVLIIEAKEKSGSLITANNALDQGKNVYAIPGDISKASSFGGNQLIKDGAKLVTEINDILEDFVIPGKQKSVEPREKEKVLIEFNTPNEERIYKLIEKGYRNIDEITGISGLEVHEVNGLLTMLELQELITVNYGHLTIT